MTRRNGTWVFAAMAAVCAGGCAAGGGGNTSPVVNANLVMPSALMLDFGATTGAPAVGGGWEVARNDPHRPVRAGIPDLRPYDATVQWDRERLSVSNGRPREYSTYWTGTWRYRETR